MAAIIDGTTYSGYWKLTPDDASPNSYYLVPKDKIYFRSDNNQIYLLADISASTPLVTTSATTVDGDGNALATDAAVSEYISICR